MGMEIDIVIFNKSDVSGSLIKTAEGSDGQQQWIDYHDGRELFDKQITSRRRNYELRDALNQATKVKAPSDYTLVSKQQLLEARLFLYDRAQAVLEAQKRESNIHFTHTTVAIDIWQGIADIEKVLREENFNEVYVGYLWG